MTRWLRRLAETWRAMPVPVRVIVLAVPALVVAVPVILAFLTMGFALQTEGPPGHMSESSSEVVEETLERNADSAFWNSWATEQGKTEITTQLAEGQSADVTFDLEPYDYASEGAASAAADPRLRLFFENATGDRVPVVLKPFVLGRGVELQSGEATARRLQLDLRGLRSPSPRRASLVQLAAEEPEVLRTNVGVNALTTGCAVVGLSVWNAALNTPLDYVLMDVGVGVPHQTCASGRLRGRQEARGFAALLVTATGQPADAAIHLFEIAVGAATPRTVAVFRGNTPDTDLLSWTIPGSLREYTGSPEGLLFGLSHAREQNDYTALSRDLTDRVFPPSPERREEGPSILAALRQLEAVAQRSGSSFFARLVDAEGVNRFLPLGLLDAGGKPLAASKTDVIEPLPSEQVREPAPCIGPWTTLVPDRMLDGSVAATYLQAEGLELPERHTEWSQAEEYLLREGEGDIAEGFVLLAHHGGGRLAYRESGPPSLDAHRIAHRFRPGSAAILAACSVGQLSGTNEGTPLLSKLNARGIDVAVLSPFAISGPFGARFALHFAHQVHLARSRKETPTIAELFRKTADALLLDDAAKPWANQIYEFIIAGNSRLRLCA